MSPENSQEAKQANFDIVRFGLADLGLLLDEPYPQDLSPSTVGTYCRSYDRAISILSDEVGPEELAVKSLVDMKTYSSVNNAHGACNVSVARRMVEAGEELVFNPARSIRTVFRRPRHSHLPEEEHYLPFRSETSRWLLLSADELGSAHYRDEAELIVPDFSPFLSKV